MEATVLSAMKKAGKALSAGEIAEITKLDKKDVSKAMDKLKKGGKITSPKKCYWEPAK